VYFSTKYRSVDDQHNLKNNEAVKRPGGSYIVDGCGKEDVPERNQLGEGRRETGKNGKTKKQTGSGTGEGWKRLRGRCPLQR